MKWIKKGVIFETRQNFDWLITHAAVPVADKVGGERYRIYFSGRDNINRSQIGFIEINLDEPQRTLYITDEPVVKIGQPGTFDDAGVMSSWLVNHDGQKYLYYIGWNLGVTVPFRNSIGLAISQDGGETFEKYAEGPLLDRSPFDPCFTASSSVLIEDSIWRMWYLSCVKWEFEQGKPKHYYHIKYAESRDGIHWERNGLVCIDFKSENEYAISRPSVLKEDGIYKMWYSYRGETYRIGYAESTDGLCWQRKDEAVGIDASGSGWDSEMIEYPHVFDHGGERYMLYNGNNYGETGIGLAKLSKAADGQEV